MEESDPWEWSVQEVASFFRHHAVQYCQDKGQFRLPVLDSFENALIENEVSGADLLGTINLETLRSHLGVKALGQANSVLWCIGKLNAQSVRVRSRAFNQRHNQFISAPIGPAQQFLLEERPPDTPLSTTPGFQTPQTRNPSLPIIDQQTKPVPGISSSAQLLQPLFDTATASATPTTGAQLLPPIFSNPEPQRKTTEGEQLARSIEGQAHLDQATTPNRTNEFEIQDGQGRKRRKLNLLNTQNVQAAQAVQGSFDQGFYSQSGIPIDSIFYGSAELGKEIVDFNTAEVDTEDEDPEVALTNFSFHAEHKPVGDSRFVSSRLRSFFMHYEEDAFEFHRGGRAACAIYPYSQSAARYAKTRSATVFQFQQNSQEPVVFRENAAHLRFAAYQENGNEYHNRPQDELLDTRADLLLKKYMHSNGDPDLVLDESDEDVSDGVVTETEDGDDMAEEEPLYGLSKEVVSALIDEAVLAFARDWKVKILPRQEEKHARTTWRLMKQSRTIRQALITGANDIISKLQSRIMRLREQFIGDQWHSEKAVTDMCESLQPTVDEIELYSWKIDVWQRREEPGRPARSSGRKAQPSRQAESANRQDQIHIPDEDRIEVIKSTEDAGSIQDASSKTAAAQTAVRDCSPEQDNHNDDDLIVPDNDETDDEANNEHDELRSTHDQNEEELRGIPPAQLSEDTSSTDHEEDVIMSTEDVENVNGPNDGINEPAALSDHDSDCEILEDVSQFFTQQTPSAFDSAIKIKDEMLSAGQAPGQSPTRAAHTGETNLGQTDRDDSSASPPVLITPRKRVRQRLGAEGTTSSQNDRDYNYQGEPLSATADQVLAWDMERLVSNIDRNRVLIKLLSELDPDSRMNLAKNVKRWVANADDLATKLGDALEPPVSTNDILVVFAGIFWGWLRCSFDGHVPSLLQMRSEPAKKDFLTILDLLNAILSKPKLFKTAQAVSREVIDISSDSASPLPTPRKQRKRDAKLKAGTEIAQKRAEERAAKHRRLAEEQGHDTSPMNSQDLGLTAESAPEKIMVNIGKADDEDPIYIPPGIATRIKKHQVEGVRFMWRELTAGDGSEGDPHQGCMLAHTMGLGKTMQTICLLACLDAAARSESRSTYKQIPRKLRTCRKEKRQLRVLVVCPPSLLQNWEREIQEWAPGIYRRVWTVESGLSRDANLDVLENWHGKGGILLVGYQLFTRLLDIKEVKDESARKPRGVHSAEFEKLFFEGPDVVIADEAHLLKNRKSLSSIATARIKTSARIALTGTPMSNDVPEIYALVNWVAPNYLGDSREFAGYFTAPIKDGNHQDSTKHEIRQSIIRLKVLREKIEPKVSRMGIEALKGSIPPKVEFVITLTLSDAQREAYIKYIKAVWSGSKDDVSQVTLFSWLSVLTLLTNHPRILRKKLFDVLDKAETAKLHEDEIQPANDDMLLEGDRSKMKANDASSPGLSELAGGEQVSDATIERNLSALTRESVEHITFGISNDLAPDLSAKMLLLLKIMELAKKHDEQVLIFSQSILTLDYVGELLRIKNYTCARIDGQVELTQRDSIIKNFQAGQVDAMIISTRAGGVGLNIQRASRVILLDAGFNPANEEQAIGRAYRLGQTKPVFVYRFVIGGTFESNIYDKQLFKTSLTSRIVDKKNPVRNTSRNPKQWLYEPRDVARADLSAEVGKDPKILDAILARRGQKPGSMICKLITMETLQVEAEDEPLTEEELRQSHELFAFFGMAGRSTRSSIGQQYRPPPIIPPFSSTQPAPSRSTTYAMGPGAMKTVPGRILDPVILRWRDPKLSAFPSSQPQVQERIIHLNIANANRATMPTSTLGGPPSSTAPQLAPTHGLPLP
jgi:SNF2 family DNA or RNA helicase